MTEASPEHRASSKRSQRRAAAWRQSGGKAGQLQQSKTKQKQKEDSHEKALQFYNEVLAHNTEFLHACRDRNVFDETLREWKRENCIQNLRPSHVLEHLRDEDIIFRHKSGNATCIIWTSHIDTMVMNFYDTMLRNNPPQRRACTNRRVLNDTINQWKIKQRLEGTEVIPVSISPSVFVKTLMKLDMVCNTREVSTRDEIIWSDPIEDVTPLITEEERSEMMPFDQKQMRANRAGLAFYNQMLKNNRVLRRACAYRKLFVDDIHQ